MRYWTQLHVSLLFNILGSSRQLLKTFQAASFNFKMSSVQFSHSVMSDSMWHHGLQASLSITNYQSLLKFMSIEWMMPSKHLTLCRLLLLWPSIFRSIRSFRKLSSLHQVGKVLDIQIQHQSFQWIFRIDFL